MVHLGFTVLFSYMQVTVLLCYTIKKKKKAFKRDCVGRIEKLNCPFPA